VPNALNIGIKNFNELAKSFNTVDLNDTVALRNLINKMYAFASTTTGQTLGMPPIGSSINSKSTIYNPTYLPGTNTFSFEVGLGSVRRVIDFNFTVVATPSEIVENYLNEVYENNLGLINMTPAQFNALVNTPPGNHSTYSPLNDFVNSIIL
jgi:hypothetical protein